MKTSCLFAFIGLVAIGVETVSGATTLWWDGGDSAVIGASDNITTSGQNWLSG